MIIECGECQIKVDGTQIADYEFDENETGERLKAIFLCCPVCKSPNVGIQVLVQLTHSTYDWDSVQRVWPAPENYLHWKLPNPVRQSIQEARICLKAKAYNACSVMCGRALEGICRDFKTKKQALAGGLRELLGRKIIDEKIFEWSEVLRTHRNIGAHASDQTITLEDAGDLLKFSEAICDYVYVLTYRFEEFKQRKVKIQNGKDGSK